MRCGGACNEDGRLELMRGSTAWPIILGGHPRSDRAVDREIHKKITADYFFVLGTRCQ